MAGGLEDAEKGTERPENANEDWKPLEGLPAGWKFKEAPNCGIAHGAGGKKVLRLRLSTSQKLLSHKGVCDIAHGQGVPMFQKRSQVS